MATVKAVKQSGASLGRACNYITDPKKCLVKETGESFVSGINCTPKTAIDEMKFTKEAWNKAGGRLYKHYSINFHKDEKISHGQAHEMARIIAEERFKGFEVLIATHADKGHVHTHLIVNSVCFEDGRKLRESKYDLQKMKNRHDELCKERNFTVTQKGIGFDGKMTEQVTTYDGPYAHNIINNGMDSPSISWKVDAAEAAIKAKMSAASKEDFIAKMTEQGWDTEWVDNRKHIVFINAEGNKIRAANIEKTFGEPMGKEELLNEFKRNSEREGGAAAKPADRPDIEPIDYSGNLAAFAAQRASERASVEAADKRRKQQEAERRAAERERAEQPDCTQSSEVGRSGERKGRSQTNHDDR